MTPRLAAQIASFCYPDGTVALNGIHLEVMQGEFCGILGSNGSGKTTLLKILDGIVKEYDGTVLLDGDEIRRLSPREIYGKMGLVFQNPDDQLFAHSVYEDVAFGPRNMGCGEAEVGRRVSEALEAVEMAGLARKDIQNLSYGQKKRVCIAGLLAMGHEILLLDEPTAGLDPMGEHRMMELLTRLNRESGVTIVMATHSVDLVPVFLSRLHVLSRGELVRSGTPEEVFHSPEELANVKLRLPYIAELIHRLRIDDHLPFKRLPLTIGEARREILETMGGQGKP
ncbi:energy-coupling factor ABC transporter ATP-binding protein [Geobacter sp. AOG2]|uniref:energy-coupling factor ABC transporter ATP-binding protein n=1 Tax=Geobacter sp. AOG2 TaxID=1566347 RepID=UPI001CC414C5|nr:ATP-binding cassette domain-containing protein [Geobacter sp. AOG2]GFE62677.1 putative ABC transporter ATP-binding protein [Geobacter sp. AOG2]